LKGGAAARRYAKALMELAKRDGMIAEIGAQLQQHEALLRVNVPLQRVLENPSINVQVKTDILTALLERTGPAPLVGKFLLLLVKRRRLRQLEAICMHYERMASEALHRIVAQVTTAAALDAQQRQLIAAKVAAATQKEVVLEVQVDPAILGGLVVQFNNVILDGSLRGQLVRIHKALLGG